MGFAGKLCGLGKYKTPVQAGVQTDEVLALLFRLSTSLHLAKETTSMASSKKGLPDTYTLESPRRKTVLTCHPEAMPSATCEIT